MGKDDRQHVFHMVFHKHPSDVREEYIRCSYAFKLKFCHLKLGQRVVVFHCKAGLEWPSRFWLRTEW